MAIDIKIPSVGESVQEALLTEWFKQDGDFVQKDDPLFVIETDKVTLEVVAETDGILKIKTASDTTVAIGAVVGAIEPSKKKPIQPKEELKEATSQPISLSVPESEKSPPQPDEEIPSPTPQSLKKMQPLAPSVRRLIAEKNLDISRIKGTGPGGRINKGDVLLYLEQAPAGIPEEVCPPHMSLIEGSGSQEDLEERKPMTPIRKRIAQRLLESKQNTAMLTTFNEIDMGNCMEIRTRYKEAFKKKHNISLGFMSFFVSACVEALKEIPEINAFLDGDTIVYHHYQHIGIAVGSERGLVVPVIRHAERMNFAQIEQGIVGYRLLRGVALFVFLYLVVFFLGSGLIAAYGYSLGDSLFEMASALSTVGISVGVTTPDAPAGVLWTEMAAMVLGRLEFFSVVVGSVKLARDGVSLIAPRLGTRG